MLRGLRSSYRPRILAPMAGFIRGVPTAAEANTLRAARAVYGLGYVQSTGARGGPEARREARHDESPASATSRWSGTPSAPPT